MQDASTETVSAPAASPVAASTATPARPVKAPVKWIFAAVAVIALAALFWPRGDGSIEAGTGYVLDGDGRPVTLGSRMAPVTLVHFWATWCAPCITEIPALQQLAADFADEPDFDLLMIAVDDEVTDVEPFLGELAPMALFDPNWEVANRYGTRKLPETYLVVGGKVVATESQERQLRTSGLSQDGDAPRWVGQTDWDDPALRRELRTLLDRRADRPAPGEPAG